MSAWSNNRVLRVLRQYSLPLLSGVLAAVVLANVDLGLYERILHASPFGEGHPLSLHFLVNDVFMAFFFGIAAKEITESGLPGGALNPLKKAVNPLLGTLGGVLGPILVYKAYVAITGASAIANGWGIPTATDIALAWLVARIAFGEGHPAVSFLLLLAVADDAIGLGIIAVFYPDPSHPVEPAWLGVVLGAMVVADQLRRRGVLSFWAYLLGPGVASWIGLYLGHLHPALALVPIVPLMPHSARDEGFYAEFADDVERTDTMNRFEHFFKLPVDLGLFFFGLANAGVPFSSVGPATWAVFLSLLLGKTIGVFTFSSIGRAVGFPLPTGMNSRSLFAAGLTAALGLTVALFVAGVAFTDGVLQGAAKMGALGSAVIAPLAILGARILRAQEVEASEGAARGGPEAIEGEA